MEELFRLLFKGEVVEGQHKAVVKKRLAQVLKLDGEGLERLFSGATITVKKQVDRPTAARYQQVFKQAGAHLRVVRAAVDALNQAPASASGESEQNRRSAANSAIGLTTSDVTPAQTATDPASNQATLSILPPGSDVLRPDERAHTPRVDIDTSHLEVIDGPLSDGKHSSVKAPDVSHISLAEIGVLLSDPQIGDLQNVMEIEIATDFLLADAGADLSTAEPKPVPPPPDTSHLRLDD